MSLHLQAFWCADELKISIPPLREKFQTSIFPPEFDWINRPFEQTQFHLRCRLSSQPLVCGAPNLQTGI